MQRLVKFFHQYPYREEAATISSCSTELEILPVLLPDNAGAKELRAAARKLGITKRLTVKQAGRCRYDDPNLTWYASTGETRKPRGLGDKENLPVYIGLVKLPSLDIEPSEAIDQAISDEQVETLWSYGSMYDIGVSDVAEMLDGPTTVVMSGWNFQTVLPLHGYTLESFMAAVNATDTDFDDSVSRCEGCEKWDHNDDGYTTNHRVVNGCTVLGINCGCYAEHCREHVADFADDAEHAIELETAELLQEQGKLTFVERFIGGMTDGRGGYYDGESVREGSPDKVLADLKAKYPHTQFVFTHDESGQFQTYFSVWEIVDENKVVALKGKRRKSGKVATR